MKDFTLNELMNSGRETSKTASPLRSDVERLVINPLLPCRTHAAFDTPDKAGCHQEFSLMNFLNSIIDFAPLGVILIGGKRSMFHPVNILSSISSEKEIKPSSFNDNNTRSILSFLSNKTRCVPLAQFSKISMNVFKLILEYAPPLFAIYLSYKLGEYLHGNH